MLRPRRSGTFKQEYALAEKRGRDMSKIDALITMLINEQPLSPDRKDHPLKGKYKDSRECHIQGDWVLVYEIIPEQGVVAFQRTGTHSDLF
ncbi:addiction module toxin, RelE/StbE family [Spirochaetia bacterium]|nr:addiction module toxin, RelE/StbE family [Spirochaetia bacterium]